MRLCGRDLDPHDDLRYVVRMEVYAALDPLPTDEDDDDRDHLQEVQDILERMEDSQSEQIGDDVYQQLRFDLCRGVPEEICEESARTGSQLATSVRGAGFCRVRVLVGRFCFCPLPCPLRQSWRSGSGANEEFGASYIDTGEDCE